MLRFAEAAMQVRGQAGEHQVDGARTALGHAYGGGSQFFAMWVVRRCRNPPAPFRSPHGVTDISRTSG
jgi:acetyl-CoA C-acetyltransferase